MSPDILSAIFPAAHYAVNLLTAKEYLLLHSLSHWSAPEPRRPEDTRQDSLFCRLDEFFTSLINDPERIGFGMADGIYHVLQLDVTCDPIVP